MLYPLVKYYIFIIHRDYLTLKPLLVLKNYYFFYKCLIILLVVALLLEHSFWFTGEDILKQLSHAIESFKTQKNITISILNTEVEAAFNSASDKEDPAWLIQWIINHKLVCDIISNFCFTYSYINQSYK